MVFLIVCSSLGEEGGGRLFIFYRPEKCVQERREALDHLYSLLIIYDNEIKTKEAELTYSENGISRIRAPEGRSHSCSGDSSRHEPVRTRFPRKSTESPQMCGPKIDRTGCTFRRSHIWIASFRCFVHGFHFMQYIQQWGDYSHNPPFPQKREKVSNFLSQETMHFLVFSLSHQSKKKQPENFT